MNDQERTFSRERAPSQWEVVQTFTETLGRSTLAVQVKRDFSVQWPKFNYQVGRWNAEQGKLYPLSADTEKEADGTRTLVSVITVLTGLLTKAEELVRQEVARDNVRQAERQARRETSSYGGNGGNRNGGGNGGNRHFGEDEPRSPMRKGKTNRDRNRHHRGHAED